MLFIKKTNHVKRDLPVILHVYLVFMEYIL